MQLVSDNPSISGQVRELLFADRVERDLRLAVIATVCSERWNHQIELNWIDAVYLHDELKALVCARVSRRPAT